MPMPLGSIISLQLIGRCFGQRIMLTHYYDKNEPGLPDARTVQEELTDLIGALDGGGANGLQTKYLACLPASYSLTEVKMQQLHPTRSAYVATAKNAPGTHASTASVANDSACITLRTAFSSRRDVSNKHIGPVPDSASASGLLTDPYKVILVALGNALIADLVDTETGLGWVPGIFHKNTPLTYTTDVTDFRVGEQSRVQRRRTVGLGE